MARKYLGDRGPIGDEVLRQRRDLYALAIGLSVFNLAGGSMVRGTTLGGFLPVSLAHPHVLLYAAWAGFFYFWWRFWQVSDAKPIQDFLEEVRLQAGDSKAMRKIASKHVKAGSEFSFESQQSKVLAPNGLIPKVRLARAEIGLYELSPKRTTPSYTSYTNVGDLTVIIVGADRRRYWLAILGGIPRALWFERSFADYTAPHILAIITVGIGVWRLADPAPEPPARLPLPVAAVGSQHQSKTPPAFSCELQKTLRSDPKSEGWTTGYGSYYSCRPVAAAQMSPHTE